MARVVSYKYRETDSTVWISGSGGTSASIAVDVAAIKKPTATFDPNYNARIIGLNNTIGYLTSEGQTIPVSSSEELWVYRGYQTVGAGDTIVLLTFNLQMVKVLQLQQQLLLQPLNLI